MVRYLSKRFVFLSSVVVSFVLSGAVFGSTIFSVGGDDKTASIQGKVDAFRAALGNPNNGNAPGPRDRGRREINWDGGGNNPTTAIAGTPFKGFLDTRGAQFTTPGTGFVQAPPGLITGGDGGFEKVFGNTTLSETFGVFSSLRIFSPIGSNITDVHFFIPGTNGGEPATVRGFGAIFTDVDRADSTSIQFYDISNNLIDTGAVPRGLVDDRSFSFLGGLAEADEQIFRVRITSGNTAIAPSFAGEVDIVAMDDFFHAEPQRAPDSGSGVALMGLGLGFVLFCYRRFLAVS